MSFGEIGQGLQDFGGKLAKPVQQGFGEFYNDPVKWIQEHPITYETTGPEGGFGISTQPLHEQYQQRMLGEQMEKLFDPNNPMSQEERRHLLFTHPLLRNEAIKAAMKQEFYVPSEMDRFLSGLAQYTMGGGQGVPQPTPVPSPFPQGTPRSAGVRMIDPEGNVREVSPEKVGQALKSGFRYQEGE